MANFIVLQCVHDDCIITGWRFPDNCTKNFQKNSKKMVLKNDHNFVHQTFSKFVSKNDLKIVHQIFSKLSPKCRWNCPTNKSCSKDSLKNCPKVTLNYGSTTITFP